MKRLASILLLFCFLGVGTGAAEFLHDLQHAADDAREDAIARSAGQPVQEHHHDETNCQVCAQLHVAFLASGWVPVLICLGLLVAFLTLLDTPLIPRLIPTRIDCRGPPALSLFTFPL